MNTKKQWYARLLGTKVKLAGFITKLAHIGNINPLTPTVAIWAQL